jgi:hypothetical protein
MDQAIVGYQPLIQGYYHRGGLAGLGLCPDYASRGYKPFDSLPGLQLGLNGFVTEQLTRDQTATRYVSLSRVQRHLAY